MPGAILAVHRRALFSGRHYVLPNRITEDNASTVKGFELSHPGPKNFPIYVRYFYCISDSFYLNDEWTGNVFLSDIASRKKFQPFEEKQIAFCLK